MIQRLTPLLATPLLALGLNVAHAAPVLTVGIEATYPPMSYRNPTTNESTGFNIDLFKVLAKQMNVELKFQEMSFEQLTTGLATGRIDVIGTAITDLPTRRSNMTFVDYLQTGAQMFTTASNAAGGATPEAFCGKAIGSPRTTNYFIELNAWSAKTCVAAGKPAADIQGAAGAAAVRLDLKQGRLNAAVLGPEYVKYLMSEEPGTYVLVGEPLSVHYFGFAVAKGKDAVRDQLVKGLQASLADGSYQRVLEQWHLQSQGVKQVTVDGGQ
jgi:polar amino acid transport system substrate-binding protein